MKNKLAIIGIDSMDPYVLLKYRAQLPVFDNLIKNSPTLTSRSVYPVDTIPAWASIFTGLRPENHGIFYVYDVFDPHLSDLNKIKVSQVKGKTFWDYAGQAGYRTGIVYPMLMYPAWELDNGFMVSKSPFDRRVDWLSTEIDLSAYPDAIKKQHAIPDKLPSLWGGFPGEKNLARWAELGISALDAEKSIGLSLYKNEQWDLFFIYFSLLDIIQHRTWRYFDEKDPMYRNKDGLHAIALDYYKYLDRTVGEFIEANPEMPMIVLSDHGHKSRPIKTFNINEYLRTNDYLFTKGNSRKAVNAIKRLLLDVATTLNIEPWLIKLVVKSKTATKATKSVYSSAGSIDQGKSKAYASHFAGIKSYPHGGIEINQSLVSDAEYDRITHAIVSSLQDLKSPDGLPLVDWVKRRDELGGIYTKEIYPDIIFELRRDYGVGWDIHSGLFGKSYDHKVASGGHGEEAVLLMRNLQGNVVSSEISILDTTPTILNILDIDCSKHPFDGRKILG